MVVVVVPPGLPWYARSVLPVAGDGWVLHTRSDTRPDQYSQINHRLALSQALLSYAILSLPVYIPMLSPPPKVVPQSLHSKLTGIFTVAI